MKQILLIVLCLSSHFCFSSGEEDLKKKVDKFLTELNTGSRVDSTIFENKYYQELKQRRHSIITKWDMSVQHLSDTVNLVVVRYKGYSESSGERDFECVFAFVLRSNEWRIADSRLFLECDDIHLFIYKIDTDINYIGWDLKRINAIRNIKENVRLEVIEEEIPCTFANCKKGRLKLVNNSMYDISNITIQIEHFDKEGKSVLLTKKVIRHMIRSDGYEIFEWVQFDCFNCYTRKYSILF